LSETVLRNSHFAEGIKEEKEGIKEEMEGIKEEMMEKG
jgi:hypothetical protein